MHKTITFTFLLLLISSFLLGQGINHKRFNSIEYNGGHENWDICPVGTNIAFANQEGLLFFIDGNWSLYRCEPDNHPKALCYINQKLYTAFGNTIGYFCIKNDSITGAFIPINITQQAKEFNLVWKIITIGSDIYFQTDQHLILIKDGKFEKTLPFKGKIHCIFKVNNDIYFIDETIGLLKNFKTVPNGLALAGKEINVILPFSNGDLLMSDNTEQTFLRYDHQNFTPIFNNKVMEHYPFCGIKSKDNFLIGTTENGLYELSQEGEIVKHYSKENQYIKSKVFALNIDRENNLWVGQENGVERFSFDLPYINIDFENKHGNPINVESIDDHAYFLTSIGIYFLKTQNIFSYDIKKEFVPWSPQKGPHYFIKKVGNGLLYGNIFGLFYYQNGEHKAIVEQTNCTAFKKLSEDYFLIYIDHKWLLINYLDKEFKIIQTFSFPKNIVLQENKIIWVENHTLFVQKFSSDLVFEPLISFETKEKIEELFTKNDSLFFNNSDGCYNITHANKNKLTTQKYNTLPIAKIGLTKVALPPSHSDIQIIFDTGFPLNDQISNFINEIITINNDKKQFLKQLNDTLFIVGTYKGFTAVNTKKILLKNDLTINRIKFLFKTEKTQESYSILNNDEIFLSTPSLEISFILDSYFYPQEPEFRFVYILNNQKYVGEWQKSKKLILPELVEGQYTLSIESQDWFGNKKVEELGSFTIKNESMLNFTIKLIILGIILMFLSNAIYRAFFKNNQSNPLVDNQE